MPNHLIHETSPYLLQHASNPVDWYPWGEEALQKARQENKPIFLSIGYAACHWCHVMEAESFKNSAIAELLNRSFISIKVDREERPDLDSIYMNAVVAMTGQGGWPMSIFLTPQGEPFYGGTYFPPTRRYGMPSFGEVLHAVAKSWTNDTAEIRKAANNLTQHIQETSVWSLSNETPPQETLAHQAAQALLTAYDWKAGGWGGAPKFPQPMSIDFLHTQVSRGNPKAGEAATHALERMSRGGLYDVVGGGFHRYSTDGAWLVPHFEKMLYDNAQLALSYLHSFLLTGNIYFRQVATETLDFILRELTDPLGGFYSSLDADSEGEEGKYYVWSPTEIDRCLPDLQDREFFNLVYPLPKEGNFEGRNVLQRGSSIEETARKVNLPIGDLINRLAGVHRRLFEYRQTRIRPATDDKVLVSWNALAMRIFAEAGRYLNRLDYLNAAQKNANFLLSELYPPSGLLRAWRRGQARHPAFLEDHAGLIIALLELYQSDPDVHWFQFAQKLAADMLSFFRDPKGGFFDTRSEHGELIVRPKDVQDNATPSGNAMAASALLRLAEYTGNQDWRELAEGMLSALQDMITRHPTAFAYWLQAADFAAGPVRQVVISGPAADSTRNAMVDYLWQEYRPRMIFAAAEPEHDSPEISLLNEREMLNGKSTAYVCEGFTCKLPVNDLPGLQRQMKDKN